jgi:antitoxin component of MazEF toxin-antitoxin module
MQTQSIFQVGNSNVVAIPAHLMKDLGLKNGQKVIVEKSPDTDGVIVTPVGRTSKKPTKITKEFEQWLHSFLEEDKALLDELATR